jgi:hypothetical protein
MGAGGVEGYGLKGLEVYRRAVWHLRWYPAEQYDAWLDHRRHPAGPLFRFCSPDGNAGRIGDTGLHAGDPLMIRLRPARYAAWTAEATAEAAGDWLAGGRDQRRRPTVLAAGERPTPGRLSDCQLVWLAYFQLRLDETLRDAAWRKENAKQLAAPWEDEADGWGGPPRR